VGSELSGAGVLYALLFLYFVVLYNLRSIKNG